MTNINTVVYLCIIKKEYNCCKDLSAFCMYTATLSADGKQSLNKGGHLLLQRLEEHIEKNSPTLDRNAQYTKTVSTFDASTRML